MSCFRLPRCLSSATARLLALTGACGFWSLSAIAAADWADITEPLPGEPRIIGHHGGACLVGAEQLPPEGEQSTQHHLICATAEVKFGQILGKKTHQK